MDICRKNERNSLIDFSLEKIIHNNVRNYIIINIIIQIGLSTFRAINNNCNKYNFDSKKFHKIKKIDSNRNYSYSKQLMKNNKISSNDSRNIILKSKNEGLKTSLSFNNFNIYSNSNITYSIESTINKLLRKMSDLSFDSQNSNKRKKNSKESKYNFINVNSL